MTKGEVNRANNVQADYSNISWTHYTWNPWVGCDKIAPECIHCYIDREIRKQVDWQNSFSKHTPKRQPWGEVYLTNTWRDPYEWYFRYQLGRVPRNTYERVFTCSLSDFFHAKVDGRTLGTLAQPMHLRPAERLYGAIHGHLGLLGELMETPWRRAAWQVIKETPNLIYLILTKRPENILSRLPEDWGDGYPNVWLGTSVGCNLTLSKLDSLRQVPVHPQAVRFLSCEPLLEDISGSINLDGIGWVIAGGESGSNPEYRYNPKSNWIQDAKVDRRGRRTMDIMWAYNLMLAAKAAGLPFWFKQVTAPKAGTGEDALGFIMNEVPPPPNGIWAEP